MLRNHIYFSTKCPWKQEDISESAMDDSFLVSGDKDIHNISFSMDKDNILENHLKKNNIDNI